MWMTIIPQVTSKPNLGKRKNPFEQSQPSKHNKTAHKTPVQTETAKQCSLIPTSIRLCKQMLCKKGNKGKHCLALETIPPTKSI